MKKLSFILLFVPLILFSQNISDLKLQDVNGKTFVVKDHLEQDATIVLFWATWCIPCKKEFPAVQELIKKYPEKKVQVLTISKDTPRSLSKVKAFVRTHDYKFTYLLDPNGEISSKLLVNLVPTSMLIDQTGKVIYSHTGYRKGDEAELEKEILKLFASKESNETEEKPE